MTAEDTVTSGAVVIGASVGAIDALLKILPQLPHGFPFPVLVVVHLPRHKDSLLPAIFSDRCAVKVKEAEDKEELAPGIVYFAPPDYHLLVNPDLTISLSSDETVHFSRPSVDVLFESAALVFGDQLTGVVLTGSNADGAEGLRIIAESGGRCIVQLPSSAEGRTMPATALSVCPSAFVLDPHGIGTLLRDFATTLT